MKDMKRAKFKILNTEAVFTTEAQSTRKCFISNSPFRVHGALGEPLNPSCPSYYYA
jgi:hypothetical protein